MRKVALGLLSLGFASFFGCTAILGSFEVAAGNGTNPDGSSDAPGSETSSSDAGDAADGFNPADYLLNCSLNETKILTLDQSSSGFERKTLRGYRTDQSRFRLVYRVTPAGAGGPPPIFRVGSVNLQPGGGQPQFTTLDAPVASGGVVDTFRFQGGIGIVTYETNGNTGVLKLYRLMDNFTAFEPVITLTTAIPGGGPDSVSGGAIPMNADGTDVFLAINYFVQNGVNWSIARYSGNALDMTAPPHVVKTFAGSNGGGVTSIAGVLHGRAGKVLIFDGKGPDPQSGDNTGTTYYEAPDTEAGIAALPGQLSGTSLTSQGSPPAVTLTGANTAAGLNLCVGEIDFSTSAKTPLVLRGGALPMAKLGNFGSADLPVLAAFNGIKDIPFERFGGDGPPNFRFVTSDDLFGVGPGIDPTFKGVNLLWYNTSINVLRAKVDSSKPLLGTHTIEHITAISAQTLAGPFADFDLAWTEIDTAVSSTAQKLFTGHLSCLK